jgi:hypothetical protein
MYTPFGSWGKSCRSFGAVRPGIRYVLARGFFADDPPKLSETLRLSCRAAFSLCCSRKRMSSRFDLSVVMIRFGGGAVSLVGMYSGGALRATMTRVRPAPPEPWQRPLLGRSANRLAIVHRLQDGETHGRVGVCQRHWISPPMTLAPPPVRSVGWVSAQWFGLLFSSAQNARVGPPPTSGVLGAAGNPKFSRGTPEIGGSGRRWKARKGS